MSRQAKLIIKMEGACTWIQDPDNPQEEAKRFAFDYSYWSHDGYVEKEDGYLQPTGSHYADQVVQPFSVFKIETMSPCTEPNTLHKII